MSLYNSAIQGICESETPRAAPALEEILKDFEEIPEDSKSIILSRKKNRFLFEIPMLKAYLEGTEKPSSIKSSAAIGLGCCARMICLGKIINK